MHTILGRYHWIAGPLSMYNEYLMLWASRGAEEDGEGTEVAGW